MLGNRFYVNKGIAMAPKPGGLPVFGFAAEVIVAVVLTVVVPAFWKSLLVGLVSNCASVRDTLDVSSNVCIEIKLGSVMPVMSYGLDKDVVATTVPTDEQLATDVIKPERSVAIVPPKV